MNFVAKRYIRHWCRKPYIFNVLRRWWYAFHGCQWCSRDAVMRIDVNGKTTWSCGMHTRRAHDTAWRGYATDEIRRQQP